MPVDGSTTGWRSQRASLAHVTNKRSFMLLKSDCDNVWYNSKSDGVKEIHVFIFLDLPCVLDHWCNGIEWIISDVQQFQIILLHFDMMYYVVQWFAV